MWYPATFKNEITPVQNGDYKSIWDGTKITNKYIDKTNGQEVSYNGWSCTDFLEISDNTNSSLYRLNRIYLADYNAFYDSSKTFISGFGSDYVDSIPNNAKYVRYSANTANMVGDILVYIGD